MTDGEGTAPNPSTALATVVVDELVRNGVRHLVHAPGSRSAALALAAAAHEGMDVRVETDERSAGFLALGIGLATGSPAAVSTTSGTAVANVFPAVVEADAAGIPLVVLSADRPPELRHVGANQTIDQLSIFGSKVRWFSEVGVAEDRPDANRYWRSTVCRAVAEASGWGSPPGPVHLNLSFREPLVPASDDGRTRAAPFMSALDGRPHGEPWTRSQRPMRGWSFSPLGPAQTSVRPLVVIGQMPNADAIAEDFLDQGVPVIAEAHSGARVPGTIAAAHHLLGHPGFVAGHRPDVVATFGRVGLSRNLQRLVDSTPRHVAVTSHGWPDPGRGAAEMWAVPVALPVSPERSWIREWAEADALVRRTIDDLLDGIEEPTEPRAARDVACAVEEGGVLGVASSMPVRDLDWFMPPRRIRVLANRGASGIDGFVSTVLGAAIGLRRPMVALIGDLALLHDSNGFLLAERPDAVLVVVDNDGGGIFSFLPQAGFPRHFERLFGTPHGRDLARLAAFHQLAYTRVERAADLIGAVRAQAGAGGVGLVHVRTDRDANVAVHRRIEEAVVEALDAASGSLTPGQGASPGA